MKERYILKIRINSEGKFVSHRGSHVDEFRDDFVEGNGWRCKRFSDGSIKCKAYMPMNEEGENSISFKISKFGYACLSETRKGVKTELRRFKLKAWPVEGIIGLTDGDIDTRYGYFQDAEFQRFLSQKNIYAVKRQDPNHSYTIYTCFFQEENKNAQETISTDGKIVELGKNYGRSEEWGKQYPGTYSFEKYQLLRIVDATWVLITEQDYEKETTRRKLYTMLEINELQEAIKC